jgi:hypothetical protein
MARRKFKSFYGKPYHRTAIQKERVSKELNKLSLADLKKLAKKYHIKV